MYLLMISFSESKTDDHFCSHCDFNSVYSKYISQLSDINIFLRQNRWYNMLKWYGCILRVADKTTDAIIWLVAGRKTKKRKARNDVEKGRGKSEEAEHFNTWRSSKAINMAKSDWEPVTGVIMKTSRQKNKWCTNTLQLILIKGLWNE
jgi:hypothetical protein